jgi:hypothetical protein
MMLLDGELDVFESKYYWDLDANPALDFDFQECALSQSLRCQAKIKVNSARIKLHRYEAFLDRPIFTKKHCDLQGASGTSNSCCGSTFQQFSSQAFDATDNWLFPSPTVSDNSSNFANNDMLFSNISSAKACMGAALEISRAFEALPYPNATLAGTGRSASSSPHRHTSRTMPAFSCCAMQSSYALLMLCHKSLERRRSSSDYSSAPSGLGELYVGLERILCALQNYSVAFEAIDGMRGKSISPQDGTVLVLTLHLVQIQEAFDVVKEGPQNSIS